MRATVLVAAVVVAGCNGQGTSPTAPSAPLANSTPIVRAVTVDRTNVEAGTEVTLTAALEGNVTPGQLRFVWSVAPTGGTLTNQGVTARWRAPLNDPVPADYVFSVAVIASGGGQTEANAAGANRGQATSPTVTVNDARRETQAHATAFLSDFANTGVAPAFCVRNFTDACGEGKRAALDEATAVRDRYSNAMTSYAIQYYLRTVEWANCTGADGSATCALLIYTVDTVWTRRADGVSERTHGYQYLRAIYDRNRWSLCSSRFADNPNAVR